MVQTERGERCGLVVPIADRIDHPPLPCPLPVPSPCRIVRTNESLCTGSEIASPSKWYLALLLSWNT